MAEDDNKDQKKSTEDQKKDKKGPSRISKQMRAIQRRLASPRAPLDPSPTPQETPPSK